MNKLVTYTLTILQMNLRVTRTHTMRMSLNKDQMKYMTFK